MDDKYTVREECSSSTMDRQSSQCTKSSPHHNMTLRGPRNPPLSAPRWHRGEAAAAADWTPIGRTVADMVEYVSPLNFSQKSQGIRKMEEEEEEAGETNHCQQGVDFTIAKMKINDDNKDDYDDNYDVDYDEDYDSDSDYDSDYDFDDDDAAVDDADA